MGDQINSIIKVEAEEVDGSMEEPENMLPHVPTFDNFGFLGHPVQDIKPTPSSSTGLDNQQSESITHAFAAPALLLHPVKQEEEDDGGFIKDDSRVEEFLKGSLMAGPLVKRRRARKKKKKVAAPKKVAQKKKPPPVYESDEYLSSESEEEDPNKRDEDEDFVLNSEDSSGDEPPPMLDELEDDGTDLGSEKKKKNKMKYTAFEKECHYCPMKFESLLKAQTHMKSAHKNYGKLICGICEKKSCSKGMFRKHLNSHDVEKLNMCHTCGAVLSDKSTLKQHIANHTNPKKTFDCPICSKLFKTKAQQTKHTKTHEVYTCDFCSKTIKGRLTLIYHVESHINKAAFECVHCGATFSQKDNRDTHMRNNHNLICLVCGGKYFTVDEVKQHLETDHSRQEVEDVAGDGPAYEKVTRFQCKICTRYLASKQSLGFHVATHTGIGKKRHRRN